MLKINNLTKNFTPDFRVLNDINFSVEKGEVVTILGPSGSGKTTLLRCLCFLESSDKGTITFDDETLDMTKAKKAEIASFRKKMGFVFQSFNLFFNKTALENVMEGLVVARKMNKDEARDKALLMLEKVGMKDRSDFYPVQLSGGQQQRVAIARALALDPLVIFFDEPTSALDPELTLEVLNVMKKLAAEGTTMIIVTHEINFAKEVATRVIFMEDGEIKENLPSQEFFAGKGDSRSSLFLNKFA